MTNLLATVLLVTILFLATLVLGLGSSRLAGIAILVCVLAAGALAAHARNLPASVRRAGADRRHWLDRRLDQRAIVLLSALKADPAAASGEGVAMRDVVTGQARHIVSTTVTTFGFLPLILAGGGLWPPFAMAVAAGLLLSTIASFYLVPPLFALALLPRKTAAAEGICPA